MQRLTSAMRGLILGAGLVLAGALPAGAQTALEGNWVATKAETNGAAIARGRRTPALGFRKPFRDQVQGRQDRLRGHGADRCEGDAGGDRLRAHIGRAQRQDVERHLQARWRHADRLRQRGRPGERPARGVRKQKRVGLCAPYVRAGELAARERLTVSPHHGGAGRQDPALRLPQPPSMVWSSFGCGLGLYE